MVSLLEFYNCLTVKCLPSLFFFFNDTATTEIYPLSLHDALPISISIVDVDRLDSWSKYKPGMSDRDRKSTRLNSSHTVISYAVFCLKKKNREIEHATQVVCSYVVHYSTAARGGT